MIIRSIFLHKQMLWLRVVVALHLSMTICPETLLLYGSENKAQKATSLKQAAQSVSKPTAASQKLDGFARMLMKFSRQQQQLSENLPFAVAKNATGQLMVEVFIQLNNASGTRSIMQPGVEIRTQIGDILIAKIPVELLGELVELPSVRKIEISKKSTAKMDSSRVDIGADLVHGGIGLPQSYRGEGVIIGVVDFGIDFTHADFRDENGSRIHYLLEFTEDGGQNEWTKNDIDENPAAISHRDGNGAGGHGTHVTGIAAGGGQVNAAMTGIAPAAELIIVKAVRDQDSYGYYTSADVVIGCQYIFDKADALGKPAVINLSIGNHLNPHDGTSLYEQTLTNLVGPGRLIVASAGNEGDKFIHAGGNAKTGVLNETLFLADGSGERAFITMWYETGVISAVAVFAYDSELNYLGQVMSIGVGYSLDTTPMIADGDTVGFVTIEAVNTEDPNNGDGNAIFAIGNNGIPSIDVSEVVWSIGSMAQADGRVDLWVAAAGSFYPQPVGFPNEIEMTGDNEYSVGAPATANNVIAVGAYTTKNGWVDVDGDALTLRPLPTIKDRYAGSSFGPTRDGRMSPQIAAPGQIIFSALSSHITEGVGYQRLALLQGGEFIGKSGTSFASPHVAGTIALMLQTRPNLTYERAVDILAQTARTNQFTGAIPNNSIGYGYLDAHAAVKAALDQVSSVARNGVLPPEKIALRQNYPNPFNPSTRIEFELKEAARVTLNIVDITGKRVKTLLDTQQQAGVFSILWNGKNDNGEPVASGIYFARLQVGEFSQTRKMALMR